MKLYNARIISICDESADVKTIWIETLSTDFSFIAGQWVRVQLTEANDAPAGFYSISSSPLTQGKIQLTVKYGQNNEVTRYFHESATPGDTLFISSGQGLFQFEHGLSPEIVLIGAGTGIAPLVSIIRYAISASPRTSITLVYGMRHASDFLFRNELEVLSNSEKIKIIPTLSKPHPEWTGSTGRISSQLINDFSLPKSAKYFLCGPPGMIDEQVENLIKIGVPDSHLVYERWW